jgi:hypothetical protein
MDRHSVGRCAPAEAASGAEIKCLVFLADGQPLLVVLRLEDRVRGCACCFVPSRVFGCSRGCATRAL